MDDLEIISLDKDSRFKPEKSEYSAIVKSKHLKLVVSEEQEKDDLDCLWFHHWRYGLNIFYYLCVSPFRLSYGKKSQSKSESFSKNRHFIEHNPVQRGICYFLNFLSLNTMRVVVAEKLESVRLQGSQNPLIYFDLIFHLGMIFFGIIRKQICLFQEKSIVELFEKMRQLQILQIASRPNKYLKIAIFSMFFIYTIPSFLAFYGLEFGLDPRNNSFWTDLYDSMGKLAISQFGFLENLNIISGPLSSTAFFPILSVLAFFLYVFEAVGWFYNDCIGIATIFTVFSVSSDFFSHIRTITKETETESKNGQGNQSVEDVEKILTDIDEYKSLLMNVNRIFGVPTCIYASYCNCFYALHLVELLAETNVSEQFLMATQVSTLTICYFFVSQTSIQTSEIRRWLRKNNRWSKIDKRKLSIILHDLKIRTFSVGSLCKIDPGFVGEMTTFLVTIAFVVIGFQQKS